MALTGIYAVTAYSVSQRAREIDIRVALGARRANITGLFVGEGARFIGVGLAAGLVLAIGVVRLVSTMLFGIAVGNVATFAQVSAVVASASVLASALATVRVRS